MNPLDDPLFDDLFHACALQAFLAEAAVIGGPPDARRTRRRAFALYERALAERVADRRPA